MGPKDKDEPMEEDSFDEDDDDVIKPPENGVSQYLAVNFTSVTVKLLYRDR